MLSPSGAGIWYKCPGNGILSAQLHKIDNEEDEGDNSWANEGSCAHQVAENMLLGNPPKPGDIFFDTPVTKDMIENVRPYCRAVNSHDILYSSVEHKMDCSHILKGMKGTADAIIIDKDHVLHIYDLKYGYRYVPVEENKQLLIYAGAAFDELDKKHDIHGVELHIYQPRSFDGAEPMRSWSLTLDELGEWTEKLMNAVGDCMSDNPNFRTGEHCRYCSSRYACKALLDTASVDVEMIQSYSHAVDMDAEQMALALDMFESAKKTMKSITTGLEEALIHKIKGGEFNKRYEYTRSLGNSQWNLSLEEIIEFGKQYDVVLAPPKPITPAQAKKAGVPKEVVDAFTERPQRGFKLKRLKGFKNE